MWWQKFSTKCKKISSGAAGAAGHFPALQSAANELIRLSVSVLTVYAPC
jgi:hypothetical protein